MSLPLSARTRVLALLGDPVAHSLSPAIQNAAIRAADLDAVYVALRCDAASLPTMLRGLAWAGGGGNVTVPHKEIAARCVEVPSEAVRRTGACNAFWLEDGRVHGDNTDVAGFAAAAASLLGHPLAGARVLVLGAGGAARAVLAALAEQGARHALVVNRTPGRAEALAQRFRTSDCPVEIAAAVPRAAFDLAVNATSLGLRSSDPLPLRPDSGARLGAALDLVYAAAENTPWVRALRARGIPAEDGREMLLQQGAAAFQRWFGRPAPVAAMRAALPARG